MHEMSLMSGILAKAEQALEPYQVRQINSITVQAGVLANLLPDAFAFAFECLSGGTVFAGAKLITEQRPITARCQQCNIQFEEESLPLICPQCHDNQIVIISGDEVFLTSIDFEEEGANNAD